MYNGRCVRCNRPHAPLNALCPQCREIDPGYEYQNFLNDLGKLILWASTAAITFYIVFKLYRFFW